ncbi:sugar-binding protein [Melghirimyces algeriensis]|uniref:sugar-binding protein n=1 Tax=Melghirimyces algeriensis TaxID=910412 RepID=UPI00163D9612|nr:sugar-binding protein [Melghirimyces algeriensis]
MLLISSIGALILSLYFSVYFAWQSFQYGGPIERKAAKKDYKYHVVFISQEKGSEYWKQVKRGAKDAAAEYDVVVEFKAPLQPNIDEHVDLIEMASASKVDGIITQGLTEEAFTPVINQAVDHGIQVITMDSDVKHSKRYAYIGTDNYRAGFLAGQRMVRELGGKGEVGVVTGSRRANNMIQRVEGFREAIRQHEKMRIVTVKESNISLVQASQKTKEIFNQYPDVDGLFGTSASDVIGMVEESESRGKMNDVVIIGFDQLPQTLKYLKEGKIEATITQEPYQIGYQSVQSMMALLQGKPMERRIYTPVKVLDRENMQAEEEDGP